MSTVFNQCYLIGSLALTAWVLFGPAAATSLLPYSVGCLSGYVVRMVLTPRMQA